MRLNQYIALHTGVGRRRADQLIKDDKVLVNNGPAELGQTISEHDKVVVNGLEIRPKGLKYITIMLNKPVGYVCSRNGQGSKTIYDLLPQELYNLKPVGRLDKDSSGLLVLTNDGQLANDLTHPSKQKVKLYEAELDKLLSPDDKSAIEKGVKLEDGLSMFNLQGSGKKWQIAMYEGRNRQIRRTFSSLDYKVTKLHRTQFGHYKLSSLETGTFKII